MAGTADDTWTNAAVAPILALHTCPARCGARRRTKLPGLSAAPCLFFTKDKLLPRHRPQRHGEHHRQAWTIARRGPITSPKRRHYPSVFCHSVNSPHRRIYAGSGRHRQL
jgi:hypothetical protein